MQQEMLLRNQTLFACVEGLGTRLGLNLVSATVPFVLSFTVNKWSKIFHNQVFNHEEFYPKYGRITPAGGSLDE